MGQPATTRPPSHPPPLPPATQAYPSLLGKALISKFDDAVDLPYLFKVLSVHKALSIQAHPDKTLAAHLHATRPDIYKDGNHKPEMALALSDFSALCGFVDLPVLSDHIQTTPELAQLLQARGVTTTTREGEPQITTRDDLQRAWRALMASPEELYAPAIRALVARLSAMPEQQRSYLDRLVLRLDEQFPSDVGILAAYFLNHLSLPDGDAIYLGANEPHAYLRYGVKQRT